MLTSLLPGLRDLRTPLAVGYLWLVVLWVWFSDMLPTQQEASGFIAAIYELSDLAGHVPSLAATAFVAYLLGAALAFFTFTVSVRWLPWFKSNRGLPTTETDLKVKATSAIMAALQEGQLVGKNLRNTKLSPRYVLKEEAIEKIVRSIHAEFPELTMKLQLHQPSAIFESVDRKTAESEFRTAVCVPLTILVIQAATSLSWWLLLLAALPIMLLAQGIHRAYWARSEVYQAMLAGVIPSSTLAKLPKTLTAMLSNDALLIPLEEHESVGPYAVEVDIKETPPRAGVSTEVRP